MMHLTDEQRTAVENGDPVRVTAPDLGGDVVLLRADLYESIKELLREEQERRIIARSAMQNAIGRMSEPP
jgi:hypothetical protein